MRIISFDIGEKNFAYAIGIHDEKNEQTEIVRIGHHNVITPRDGPKRPKKRQNVIQSCENISSLLLPLLLSFDVKESLLILIEQQMGANNRAQKIAQHVWTVFHTMKELNSDLQWKVVFVPASLKTQKFLGKNTLTPKQRKSWAAQQILSGNVLENHEEIKTQIRNMDKKDDVCDSILQLIAFLKK